MILKVVGKYPDNFHIIETIFSRVSLSDKLTFKLTENGEVNVVSNIAYLNGDKNIVHKVAMYLKDIYNVQLGIDISILKEIPVAAGLAGGSSNAATALLALNDLWDLKISKQNLHRIASMFGSDLNFFIDGVNTAIGTGRGEKIVAIKEFEWKNILLVNPGIEISAKEGYDLREGNFSTPSLLDVTKSLNIGDFSNDLESGVTRKYIEISEIINELKALGAIKSMMSGSGATCFGLFSSRKELLRASELFKNRYGYWTYATETLNGE